MAYDPPYQRQEAETTERIGFTGARHRSQVGSSDDTAQTIFPAEGYDLGTGQSGSAGVVPAVESVGGFDDPVDGEPDRDRLAVHWLWELVLFLGVAGLVYLLWQGDPGALRGESLSGLLVQATGFGLLGLAAGVTLRAGAPNFAIGPAAAAAGAYFAERGGEGVLMPTLFALGVAVLFGVAMGLVIAILHAPGWAVSLAATAGIVVWLQLRPAQVALSGEYDPTRHAAFLFAGVAAIGILGGLLGTIQSVRRGVGRLRPVGDPARRRGGAAVVVTGGALILSMVLSVIAGVVLVAGARVPADGSTGVNWLTWTMIGLAVALVGGTSAFGRRGGVFGTVLAVVGLVVFHRYQQEQGWGIALLATAAVAVLAGLAVTRLVERFGRPRVTDQPQEWAATPIPGPATPFEPTTAINPLGPPSSTDSWSSTLPVRPAPTVPAPWDDDRWGRH